jgi:hypothetical protein
MSRHRAISRSIISANASKDVGEDPAPALPVTQVEPPVVHVQHELATRLQDAKHMAEHAATGHFSVDHPQCAKQAGGVVERLISNAIQLDKICLDALYWQSCCGKLSFNNAQHLRREVHTDDTVAQLGHRQHEAAGTTAQVDQSSGWLEPFLSKGQICGKK